MCGSTKAKFNLVASFVKFYLMKFINYQHLKNGAPKLSFAPVLQQILLDENLKFIRVKVSNES